MRASRFWRIRDAVFRTFRRVGVREDPLPVASPAEEALSAAALGDAYQLFRLRTRRSAADVDWLRALARVLTLRDPIEIVLDARGAGRAGCEATLASMDAQVYRRWRARVWIDPSDGDQRAWLAQLADADERVYSQAWDARTIDPAGAIGALSAGDVLEPEALLRAALELHDGADIVYTDEDHLRDDGECERPSFKPDWSPETLLTRDYVGRLCLMRASVLAAAGGLDAGAGTAMWYDALLRVSEQTDRVAHIPHVLAHRADTGIAVTADDRARAVAAALARRGEEAVVRPQRDGAVVEFAVPADERVLVVVPTRDRAALLEICIASVFERTSHRAFEVVVVDNGSVEPATRALFARWTEREPQRFRVISDAGPFNFSRLNNRVVRTADAPYVVLLNNDTEVIAPEWMTAMLGQARRPSIGAVGALLLYADGSVQHAGVILGGMMGLTGHAYRGMGSEGGELADALLFDTNRLAVTAACLMVARAKYDEVGGLDEEAFPVGFNDVDFCVKLHAAGYRNVVVPRARLYHSESRSRGLDDTAEKRERGRRESEAFRARWPQYAAYDPYYNPNLTLVAEDFSVSR